jgi:hypothetical protein
MATEGFKIFVTDFSSSAEEWKRSLAAGEADLPELTEEQRKWAKQFGVEEKEYARGVLAGGYGRDRTAT